MASIRKTKTGSGATAVQVVHYSHDRIKVLKHIGSGRTEQEILSLVEQAMAWRATHCDPELFPEIKEAALTIPGTEFLGVRHTLTYDTLRHVATHCGLDVLEAPMLLDLAIIRLVEPSSKLRSLNLLDQYFGIQHARRSFYRQLSGLLQHKAQVERIAVTYATKILQSDLAVVLYDVTTLYFESFDSDDLRIPGFSKDNMSQQPQVVLGLLVTRQGFPLGYELFPGNTFEGKTMLPVLEAFVARHGVTTPTVVADAAMLSRPMLEELRRRGISYIVGARLANSSAKIIEEVSTGLPRQDGGIIRVPSPHGDMICSFSTKRYKKDKANFEKMLTKAQRLVATGEPGKRAKFVKNIKGKDSYTIDQDLVARSERLLGVKGYCTNIPLAALSNTEVIARYHDLWQVEKAFRMAKSDLAARPIFHYNTEAIRVHLLICFMALIMARSIEITTGSSLRNVIDTLWPISDARLHLPSTGKISMLRAPISNQAAAFLKRLGVPY